MIKSLALSVFALSVTWAHGASAQSTAPKVDLAQYLEAADPMPSHGAFAGQFAENVHCRTLILLSAEEKSAFGIAPGALAFANYRDHGHFFIAHIAGMQVDPSTGKISGSSPIIESVHEVQEHWAAKTDPEIAAEEAHSYLQFFFKKGSGVVLDYDQTSQVAVSGQATVDEVVLSIEAVRSQQNVDADFAPYAFRADFAIGHLVYSKFDRDQEEAADLKVNDDVILSFDSVTSKIASVSRPQEALLERAISRSSRLGRKQTYNVIVNNCTDRLFDLLDSALNYAAFDSALFTSMVTAAVQTEVPKLVVVASPYLQQMVSSKSPVPLDPQLAQLSTKSGQEIATYLIDGARSSTNPAKYDTWIPTFTSAHLAGRHLVSGK